MRSGSTYLNIVSPCVAEQQVRQGRRRRLVRFDEGNVAQLGQCRRASEKMDTAHGTRRTTARERRLRHNNDRAVSRIVRDAPTRPAPHSRSDAPTRCMMNDLQHKRVLTQGFTPNTAFDDDDNRHGHSHSHERCRVKVHEARFMIGSQSRVSRRVLPEYLTWRSDNADESAAKPFR